MDCGFMQGKTGLKAFFLKTFWLDLPVRRVSYITTISEFTRQEVLKYTGVEPSKVVVIPVAISEIYKPSYKEFNKENPRILQIGRARNKNFERIVSALKGLNITLVCIGKLSHAEVSYLESNKIDYKNYFNLTDDEVKNQYEQCDIMMFPSLLEGFGMPIVEAQMVGRAVITSNVTSMPEVAGVGACLVDPYSVESIRNATLQVINDEDYRGQLIANGFSNVKRFDPAKIAKQYEDLYLTLYNKNKVE
jgi:glycosyltransferase involved in cell wall biosynthesis